jgi:hypothetical protein
MLNRTFKSLIAVLIIAGALGAKSAARPTVTQRSSSTSAPRISEPAPRRRPRLDDGCRELPAPAPREAPAPIATCS